VVGPHLGVSCLEAARLATVKRRWGPVRIVRSYRGPVQNSLLAAQHEKAGRIPVGLRLPPGAHSSSVGPGCPHLRPRVWTVVLKARQKRQPVSHDGPAQGRPRDAPAPSPRPSKQHPRDCSALSSLVSPQHYGGPLLTNSSQPSCGREIELGWPISRCPRRQSSLAVWPVGANPLRPNLVHAAGEEREWIYALRRAAAVATALPGCMRRSGWS